MQFTQEIKDKWLNALKSGKYIQGYRKLQYKREPDNIQVHCCIGVLGEIIRNPNIVTCPYDFLNSTVGWENKENLWRENDRMQNDTTGRTKDYKDDYSNVIPLVEKLKVQN